MKVVHNKENDLSDLIEWVKNEKGITKITLEELMDFVPEYEKTLTN